ncbi:hypothetical protein EUTSA_v10022070mg [Eutrema salsugineum]|uniref:HTH myb-type domain-containing protein n=1 Tax=Eutrema salsugineum TaxID=72664 RepID=V4LEW8_EUTSA|nr:uncharacterized protein LOC18023769 [Eutrema salsugineum]ESQ48985.1 hypothetical protein EUTSA_v10022070mg [Eutrema salsugineum]
MAAKSWTREENVQFKNALVKFSAFCPTRFQSVAQYLQKSKVDVKERYKEMVKDLLEIGSSRIAFAEGLTDAAAQRLYPVDETIWSKEDHEWFLIGLKRFGDKWDKIADLLDTKNAKQVLIYAHNYFYWQSAKKNVLKRRRVNIDNRMVEIIDVDSPPPEQQENHHVLPQSQPQQRQIALAIGHHAWSSYSEPHRRP